MYASGIANAGILNQYDVLGILRPVHFYSRKCSPVKETYDTHDWELLAIMAIIEQWQHYLEGANYKIFIRCHLKHLEYFQISKVLCIGRDRLSAPLSAYDFVIEYHEGSVSPANGQSRQPNYEIGYDSPVAELLATVSVEPCNDLIPPIITTQASDPFAVNISVNPADRPIADGTDTAGDENQWKIIAGALTSKGRIHIAEVNSLHGQWLVRSMTSLSLGMLEIVRLPSCHRGSSTGWRWSLIYVSMSAAAKYATRSRLLSTPGTESTCPSRPHHGHGNESRWTLSQSWQIHWRQARPGFLISLTDYDGWQSTYCARTISTG